MSGLGHGKERRRVDGDGCGAQDATSDSRSTIVEGEIWFMDAKAVGKAKKHVQNCVGLNVCLCGCGRPAVRRGLAQNCYYAWWSTRRKLSRAQQVRYDAKLIRQGKLLAAHSVVELKQNSVFTQAATGL